MRRLSTAETLAELQRTHDHVKPTVESEERPPSASELHADRMLADAFGHQKTASMPPWMQRIRAEFIRGHEQGQRLQRPLDRTENTRGISKSFSKFEMVRDWEMTKKL